MNCAAVLSSVRRPALVAAVRAMSCMRERTFYSPPIVTNLYQFLLQNLFCCITFGGRF